MRGRIRLKKQFKAEPRRFSKQHPVPPGSLIRVREDNPGPHRALKGQQLRVGYYSKMDGLNVIWIVYADGQYGEATDHTYFNRHFEILREADEHDFFGVNRPKLETLP